METTISKELLSFIKKSPTCFQAVDNIKNMLEDQGYQPLSESTSWSLQKEGKYYVTRNQSSIIAFHIGSELDDYSFNIVASHDDSPTFKVKENAVIEYKDKYTQLNTEPYGGLIIHSWLDKPLSLAGRVIVREGNKLVPRLLNIDRDLLIIPNQAIHMNREINNGYVYNNQIDMLPLLGSNVSEDDYKQMIGDELKVNKEDIYGSDLYLYNRTQPTILGLNNEYMGAGRIDNLQCAYATLQGFLKGYNKQSIAVYVCFDNEEVGSLTKQGARSTFLSDTLKRINSALNKTNESYHRAIASSYMISADNVHAVHPSHPEKTDPTNNVYMNEGVVVKSHAAQKYTSDAFSIAIFKALCQEAQVPVQYFANRSDNVGGNTLGNLAMEQVSLSSVDIGCAQLAMHSSYEVAGTKDTTYMIKAIEAFYNHHIKEGKDQSIEISD